jgi:hypothetical protein
MTGLCLHEAPIYKTFIILKELNERQMLTSLLLPMLAVIIGSSYEWEHNMTVMTCSGIYSVPAWRS